MKAKLIQYSMALVLIALVVAVFLMTSCSTANKAIESAEHKSLVGNGFLAINKITVTDGTTQTYTPQLFSLFLSGKYVSLLNKAKFLFYDKQSSASTFNSNAITTEENLIIQTDGTESMASIIAQLKQLQESQTKEVPSAEQKTEKE